MNVHPASVQKVVWFEAIDPGGTVCTGDTDEKRRIAIEAWELGKRINAPAPSRPVPTPRQRRTLNR